MKLKRRDVLRATLILGAVTGALEAAERTSAGISKKDERAKRRSQYQPNSAEVQTFYRVNSYPAK